MLGAYLWRTNIPSRRGGEGEYKHLKLLHSIETKLSITLLTLGLEKTFLLLSQLLDHFRNTVLSNSQCPSLLLVTRIKFE